MDVSLAEAATLLGKSPRQVRYLIKTGKLKARKDGARWRIEIDELPLGEKQRRAANARARELRDAVEAALAPVENAAHKARGKRFSVQDLRAFRSGEPVFRAVVEAVGEDDPAGLQLRRSLDALAQGCHAFRPPDKAARYEAAREAAASAVVSLLLGGPQGDEARRALADRVEQEYLPDVSSLIRVTERRGRRTRFDRFAGGQRSR